ncbi:MAG: metallophosphoesterase family protein [bacterium]
MRYLIFSDSHLSNSFNRNKLNFLKKIVKSADKIIINGDFWEGYNFNINDFTKSKWSNLFKLLKSKNAIYLLGNHDKLEYSNKKTGLFSIKQQQSFKLKSGNKTFYIEHGDKITPLWDRYFKRMPNFINKFLYYLEKAGIYTIGIKGVGILYKRFNTNMKKKVSVNLKKNEYLICGHSHYMEIDEKNHFINSGFIKHGLGQYITIENGKVKLHNEKY